MSAPTARQAARRRCGRPSGSSRRSGPGRRGAVAGMVGAKSENFGPSAKRLIGRMRPNRGKAMAVLALALLSVGCSVSGPKILAGATNIIFAGLFGRKLPAGITKQQAIAGLRLHHENRIADMLGGDACGSRAGHRLRGARPRAADARSRSTSWPRSPRACRASCSTTSCSDDAARCAPTSRTKLNDLPLRYFDRQPRGELLSRVTNDIDNVARACSRR